MASYLVTQATGQQSQSVIKHLLAAGVKVHAVVRDLEKVPVLLKSPGVTLFKGESKNFEDIYQAAQGCKGAFLNTLPIPGFEAHQAQTIAEASNKAGVGILVAATTLCTDKKTLWDDQASEECQIRGYYASKTQVEDIVRGAGFKAYTILRPAILHQDYLVPGAYQNYPRLPTHGELDHAFNEGVKAPYTDADDVGKYAAAALQNPDKFGGQEIDLASELLTVEEARDILVKVSGKDVPVRKRTPEEIEAIKDTVFGQKIQLWANLHDFSAYASTAKEVQAKFGIPFTPLEASLQRDRARLLECLSAAS